MTTPAPKKEAPAEAPSPMTRALMALSVVEGGMRLVTQARNFYHQRFSYTVTVIQGERMYNDVHRWLLSSIPEENHRAVVVTSRQGSGEDGPIAKDGYGSGDERTSLRLLLNESRTRRINLDGHSVQVALVKPDLKDASANMTAKDALDRIVFTARTRAAADAVVNHLREIQREGAPKREPMLSMTGTWGGWQRRRDLPGRTLDSVALPAAQKDRIVADLRQFLDDEERYARLAIPWHRGYMFHGPPGTGKTSLVRALATHFNLDLWYISLSDLQADASLMNLISEVGPRSVLLLEDIDTVQITRDRGTTKTGVSMGALLNALDGVGTPHGLITFMTTNRFETLDEALTRAGRMDAVEHIDHATRESLGALFEHFYGRPLVTLIGVNADQPINGLSTAAVAEVFKGHIRDADAAEEALLKVLVKHGVHAVLPGYTDINGQRPDRNLSPRA